MINKKNLIAAIICFLCLSMWLVAQENPRLHFLEERFDFGEIEEEAGSVDHVFKFLNRGGGPLVIENIQVSCGCSSTKWTQGLILPGDTGFVNVEFDPLNRPGRFQKSLVLQTNSEDSIKHLFISGSVRPKESTIIRNLATSMGNLRTRFKSFNLGVITNEKPFSKSFDIYNEGVEELVFLDSIKKPDNLIVSIEPSILKPKELGRLTLVYDPGGFELLGFNSHKLVLYTNEDVNSRKEYNVLATVEEFFPKMSDKESSRAPILVIPSSTQEFSKVDQGEVVTSSFEIQNAGKSVLEIRALKPNCECVRAEMSAMSIQPGRAEVLKVTFDTSGRRANQMKMISIFSNDPSNSIANVLLKGYVEHEAE